KLRRVRFAVLRLLRGGDTVHVLFGGVWLIGGFGSHVSSHSSTEGVHASRFVRTRLPRFAPSGAIAGQLDTPCIRLRGALAGTCHSIRDWHPPPGVSLWAAHRQPLDPTTARRPQVSNRPRSVLTRPADQCLPVRSRGSGRMHP